MPKKRLFYKGKNKMACMKVKKFFENLLDKKWIL